MKLFVVLSVIAYGYADKLDRTYLPPAGAATAGGSPGALRAPGSESAFGQGLPTTSGSQPGTGGIATSGSSSFGASNGNGFSFPSTGSFGQGLPSTSGSQPGTTGFKQPGVIFGQRPSGVSQPSTNGFGKGPSSSIQPGSSGFGQGPSGAAQPGTNGFSQGPSGVPQPGANGFGQGPSGVARPGSNGFGQGPSGVAQLGSNGFGQGPSGVTRPGSNGFGQGPSGEARPGSNGFGQGTTGGAQPGANGFGQRPSGVTQNGLVSSNIGGPSGNGYGFSKPSVTPSTSYSSVPGSTSSFGSSGFTSTQSNDNKPGISQYGQGPSGQNFAQAYTPERSQAAADRNAEILKYVNENNIDSYNYSYETSNGISAEEAGEATNGVRAQGAYSYTGDDGNKYTVIYTADENGYQPQGEHLPTPPPIPEEILKSIEENARAAAAGTQEGAYRPEEYESEVSQPQYNAGVTGYNQPEGQSLGSGQGYPSGLSPAVNRPGGSQFSASQGLPNQGRPGGQASLAGQSNLSGQSGLSGQSSLSGQSGLSGQSNQPGQFGQGSQLSQNNQGQGQSANGYKYNQPQSAFGPTAPEQGPSTTYSTGPRGSGSVPANTQGNSLFGNDRPSVPSFGTSQTQFQAGLGQLSGNQPGGFSSTSNQGQSPFGSKQPSFGSAQTQNQAGLGQLSGTQQGGVNASPNQVQSPFGSKQPLGSPSSSGNSQYRPSNAVPQRGDAQIPGSFNGQGNKNQYFNKPAGASSIGSGQPSFTGNQNSQTSISSGRPQSGSQPSFGSNVGPNQGSIGAGTPGQAGSRGSQPIQAPYEYNRPTQSFGSQPQAPKLNNGPQGSNGRPNQGNQGGTEQFGGPRQPPSFSQEEGYKY